jgi:hypothetical protein
MSDRKSHYLSREINPLAEFMEQMICTLLKLEDTRLSVLLLKIKPGVINMLTKNSNRFSAKIYRFVDVLGFR